MAKYEFEFFDCAGRVLFAPINKETLHLCKLMRRKNLTEKEIEFCIQNNYDLTVKPRVTIKETILPYLVNYEIITRK